jgi:sugar-specific transcriptional regulator TrmB
VDTKELLRALGLTAYEAEIYEALVRLECAKVNDLARVVSVPRPQIYVALRGLMDHGLVNETRGQVSIYSAVAPAIAFKGLLKQEEELLRAKTEAIRRLNQQFSQVEKSEIPANFVQVLKGRQVKSFIDDMAAKAQDEVLIFMKSAAGQSPKSLEGATRSETAMLERGVHVRCLYEEAALADENVVALLRRLAAAGEDGRVEAQVPMNMMIFDDRAAMFSLTNQRGELTIFAFSHPDLIQVMKDGFERNWDQGRSLKQVLREIGRTRSGAKLQEVVV